VFGKVVVVVVVVERNVVRMMFQFQLDDDVGR